MQTRTYLQQNLQKGQLIRWIDNCFPLKVYIAPFRWYKAKDEGYIYTDMIHRALEAWSVATKRRVSFQIVTEYMQSQMNFSWKRIDREALGLCHFDFDNQNRLFSAAIEIGLSDGYISSKYMKKEEVYHTILHEIGHGLGLGHSTNKNDIMYTPHQYGVVNLSPNDIATMIWLYRFPNGASLEDLCNKYQIQASNIDELVAKIENLGAQSDFEKVKNSIQMPQKDLLQESANIAEIKKYTLSLQNIQISHDLDSYMKKIRQDKKK